MFDQLCFPVTIHQGEDLYSKPRKAYGGPTYEAEGQEVVDYANGGYPFVYGQGSITNQTSNSGKINGPSHAQGGVDMSGGEYIYSDRQGPSKDFAADFLNRI